MPAYFAFFISLLILFPANFAFKVKFACRRAPVVKFTYGAEWFEFSCFGLWPRIEHWACYILQNVLSSFYFMLEAPLSNFEISNFQLFSPPSLP